jgi:hypothetical protein
VILCVNPAHNGEAHTGCLVQGEAIDGGQRRGKPSAVAMSRYGPVTTDPTKGEAPVLSHRISTMRNVANLWLGQDAGALRTEVDVPSYLSGYVDGEGCFTVSISPRPTLLAGWEVRPSLSVSQNGDRNEVLLLLLTYFGCGTLRPDRSDKTLKGEVRSLSQLVARIIPHFEMYPLLSGKSRDFDPFAEICRRMVQGWHLNRAGLGEIVGFAGK